MTAIRRLFEWRVHGIRWIEVLGVVCAGLMLLAVYLTKAAAARETARIAQLDRQIAEATLRNRMLRAEVARLESPARLETLSRQAGLAPIGDPPVPEAVPEVEAPKTAVEDGPLVTGEDGQ